LRLGVTHHLWLLALEESDGLLALEGQVGDVELQIEVRGRRELKTVGVCLEDRLQAAVDLWPVNLILQAGF